MAKFEISSTHVLSDERWEMLAGTALRETMVRNYVSVRLGGKTSLAATNAAFRAIEDWLEAHLQTFVYCDFDSDSIDVYFEDSADMVAFTLAHKDEAVEYEEPAPVVKSQPKRSRYPAPLSPSPYRTYDYDDDPYYRCPTR